jgi:hypothetical protein
MPRSARADVGGYCYHVMSRGNRRAEVFHKEGDYASFCPLAACRVRPHGHAAFGLLSDAQPFPPGTLAKGRRPIIPIHAMAHDDSHPALARPPSQRRSRPPLPRPIQELPDPGKQPFSHRMPICRTQSPARQSRRKIRRLAMEFDVRSREKSQPNDRPPRRLARRHAARLAQSRQRTPGRKGTRRPPPLARPRPSIRRPILDHQNRQASRYRKLLATPRTPKEIPHR